MIYVTHDQVEALTFAEQVVVMTRGRAVQVGSAAQLFERPSHTFVGHFIGSPGMNFMTGHVSGQSISLSGITLPLPSDLGLPSGDIKLGIRPEYVTLALPDAPGALPMTVTHVQDVGTHLMLNASLAGQSIKARLPTSMSNPVGGATVWLKVLGGQTCFYKNEEIVA
jgi:glycerol transport system ATP-binding protein